MKKWVGIWNLKNGWLSMVGSKGKAFQVGKCSMKPRDDNLGRQWIVHNKWEQKKA